MSAGNRTPRRFARLNRGDRFLQDDGKPVTVQMITPLGGGNYTAVVDGKQINRSGNDLVLVVSA